jgi:hypothetical protein
MKTRYLIIILVVLLVVVSCKKKKKKQDKCEFNKLEYVEYAGKSTDIKKDKTILECLQLEVKDNLILITNEAKTINIKFSTSGKSIVEEIDINVTNELNKSFDSVDEQEIELEEKASTWEINFKSDNSSMFNGYLKLYKTSDGDYWKKKKESEELSFK